MMGFEIGLIALAAAQAAPAEVKSAPFPGAAKMLIFSGGSVAVADYPTLVRCESARSRLAELIKRQNEANPPVSLPNGGVVGTLPLAARTLCIPG